MVRAWALTALVRWTPPLLLNKSIKYTCKSERQRNRTYSPWQGWKKNKEIKKASGVCPTDPSFSPSVKIWLNKFYGICLKKNYLSRVTLSIFGTTLSQFQFLLWGILCDCPHYLSSFRETSFSCGKYLVFSLLFSSMRFLRNFHFFFFVTTASVV